MATSTEAIDFEALFATAARVQTFAYAPYSRFRVGAAILGDDGVVYPGCNVENAAYPSGSCAEQGAISAMIAGGGRRIRAIAGPGGIRQMFSLAELLPASFGPDNLRR